MKHVGGRRAPRPEPTRRCGSSRRGRHWSQAAAARAAQGHRGRRPYRRAGQPGDRPRHERPVGILQQEGRRRGTCSFGEHEEDVLCALALVHADAHKKIPEFDAALRAYLARVDPAQPPGSHQTYVNGLLCMLIQAYGDPAFEPKLRTATRWLVESQGRTGRGRTTAEFPRRCSPSRRHGRAAGRRRPPAGCARRALEAADALAQGPLNGDNSCTQYAMLGLQSAASSGIDLPADLWKRALDIANGPAGHQERRVGLPRSRPRRRRIRQHDRRRRLRRRDLPATAPATRTSPRIRRSSTGSDGWTSTSRVEHAPRGRRRGRNGSFYWLYSVERVGRMLDTDFIGIHEWYPEGAAWLVHGQQADGMWHGPGRRREGRHAPAHQLRPAVPHPRHAAAQAGRAARAGDAQDRRRRAQQPLLHHPRLQRLDDRQHGRADEVRHRPRLGPVADRRPAAQQRGGPARLRAPQERASIRTATWIPS